MKIQKYSLCLCRNENMAMNLSNIAGPEKSSNANVNFVEIGERKIKEEPS